MEDYECVSEPVLNKDVEKWIAQHFASGSSIAQASPDCQVTRSAIEYHRRHHLYQRFHNLLSDITLAKAALCLKDLHTMHIYQNDTIEYLVDYILETVCNNPCSLLAYARLCQEIMKECRRVSSRPPFYQILTSKCQLAFDKKILRYTERRLKEFDIKRCSDPSRVKCLKIHLEIYDTMLRRKYQYLIQFIGELYQFNNLTDDFVISCLCGLLDRADDESFECICTLLKITGKTLEEHNYDLSQIFYRMDKIIDDNRGSISCAVWRIVQDVFNLRGSRWMVDTDQVEGVQK
ncbi:hypothetical protein FQA39_LY11474 [Lamprigera yunnana]|nr:hypothetical protein FQA39_LY11474 [Lamprigera yunnana]